MNVKRLTFIKMNKYLLPTEMCLQAGHLGLMASEQHRKLQGDSFVLGEQGKWPNRDYADLVKGFNIWRATCSTLSQHNGQRTFTQTRAEHRLSGGINK
jgi:hypothetical protein